MGQNISRYSEKNDTLSRPSIGGVITVSKKDGWEETVSRKKKHSPMNKVLTIVTG